MHVSPAFAPTGIHPLHFRLDDIGFDAIDGFAEDDLAEAMAVFRRSAEAIVSDLLTLRSAMVPNEAFRQLCSRVLACPPPRNGNEARHLIETFFAPWRVSTGSAGFLTGYYEPLIDGSLEPSPDFSAPILRRPFDVDRIGPGVADRPYLDRASIEARISGEEFQPVVWLRDWVEVFFVHVQGSARVRLPDGKTLRLVYDGRNGQPYTSIGRLLVERGEIPAEAMSLDRLKGWIRTQGQEIGAPGRALMQSNRSYIFFRGESDRPNDGPIGGAGIPLSPLRSIAVDRTVWPYGLPFFIEATLPWRSARPEPFRRLMIAQDTGSAILGPARADLYCGTGDEAGRRAGDIRHAATFTVFLPRAPSGGV